MGPERHVNDDGVIWDWSACFV